MLIFHLFLHKKRIFGAADCSGRRRSALLAGTPCEPLKSPLEPLQCTTVKGKIDFWSTCLGGYFVALLGYPGLNLGFLCFPKDFQGFRWFKLGLNLGFICFSKDFQGFRWFRPGLNLAFLCFS